MDIAKSRAVGASNTTRDVRNEERPQDTIHAEKGKFPTKETRPIFEEGHQVDP